MIKNKFLIHILEYLISLCNKKYFKIKKINNKNNTIIIITKQNFFFQKCSTFCLKNLTNFMSHYLKLMVAF